MANWAPTTKHNTYTSGSGIGLMVAAVIDYRLYAIDLTEIEMGLIAIAVGWVSSYIVKESPQI